MRVGVLRRGRPPAPLTDEECCPDLEVVVPSLQVAEGLCQVGAELILAVAHLGSMSLSLAGARAGRPWGPGGQPPIPSLLWALTKELQRKWRAQRPFSQASAQKRVCGSRHWSSTEQR